jgi:hypothetical protein
LRQRPNSIWGDANLKAFAKVVEEEAPELFAGPPAALSAKPAIEMQVADSAADVVDVVFPANDLAEAPEAADQSRGLSTPLRKRRGKRGNIKRQLELPSQPVNDVRTMDELTSLDEENMQLRKLLAAKLANENDVLRKMISRF